MQQTFNRRGLAFLILFLALCIFPAWAIAHDGWVEVTPTIIEKGQVATLALIQGNHSNEHKSYRIAGKWDAKNTMLAVVDPKGQQNELTDRIIDLGEDEEKVGPKGPKASTSFRMFQKMRAFIKPWLASRAACSRGMGRNL